MRCGGERLILHGVMLVGWAAEFRGAATAEYVSEPIRGNRGNGALEGVEIKKTCIKSVT